MRIQRGVDPRLARMASAQKELVKKARTESRDTKRSLDQFKSMNESLGRMIETLDAQLRSQRELSEMDAMKLQQLYQNYNQAMSTLSAIMKSQHDTLKAIINNMRA